MAYDGTRPRDDDFVKESAGLIRLNFEGLRTGGLVAPRPPLYGAGVPAATLGDVFDRYINTSTGDEYYKNSSGWVRVSNLGAIYKTSAGVYYTTAAAPDSATGIVGDVCFSEGSLSQKLYVKESSGWVLKTVILKGSEKYQDMGTVSGTKNINAASGTIVKFTVGAALTITLTATTETDYGCTLTLLMRRGGAYTVTWPTSVAWSGGITPTFSATETDVVTLTTINGSDWVGAVAGATAEEEAVVADTVILTSSGSVTAPSWATKALISGCGGGGGGGSSSTNNIYFTGGVGGMGGACLDYPVNVTPSATYTITIGARGVGSASSNGTAGGTTSFGSLLSLGGGTGGTRGTTSGSGGLPGSAGSSVADVSGLFFGKAGASRAAGALGAGSDGTGYGAPGGSACGTAKGGNGTPGFLTIKWVA